MGNRPLIFSLYSQYCSDFIVYRSFPSNPIDLLTVLQTWGYAPALKLCSHFFLESASSSTRCQLVRLIWPPYLLLQNFCSLFPIYPILTIKFLIVLELKHYLFLISHVGYYLLFLYLFPLDFSYSLNGVLIF